LSYSLGKNIFLPGMRFSILTLYICNSDHMDSCKATRCSSMLFVYLIFITPDCKSTSSTLSRRASVVRIPVLYKSRKKTGTSTFISAALMSRQFIGGSRLSASLKNLASSSGVNGCGSNDVTLTLGMVDGRGIFTKPRLFAYFRNPLTPTILLLHDFADSVFFFLQ